MKYFDKDYENNIEKIINLYEKYGSKDYIGEDMTQTEHMIRAAMLAEIDIPNNKDLIIASFLHDIGHLLVFENEQLNTMGNLGAVDHEKIGANFLRNLNIQYPIPELVENHVKVKKYMVYKYPDYYNNLSEASKQTLEYQGGKMSKEDAEHFEKDPLFKDSIKLRQFDDESKKINTELKSLDYYRTMLLNH